jgi:protein involved in polysaccharide export with SLBB domain
MVGEISAQSFGRLEQTESNLSSYYYFVEPGAPTVRVYVMGPVRYPGVYELTKGTDLRGVMALTGGPDPGRIEFVNRQRTTIRLYRKNQKGQSLIYESQLEKSIADSASSPELEEGDVIAVEVAAWRRFDWRDILTIVSVLNTVMLIFLAFDNMNE